MTDIAPTVTAKNSHLYRTQVENIERFADRAHLDFSDGEFSPVKMLTPAQAWKPAVRSDFHLMFKDALSEVETIISLDPDLVILHVESENLEKALKYYQGFKIKTGLAFLAETDINKFSALIKQADHALIFAGKLGYQGGEANLDNLKKVEQIKKINPKIEIGWDGGINHENAKEIADAGVDVLNVGGFIQKSDDPDSAYVTIKQSLKP